MKKKLVIVSLVALMLSGCTIERVQFIDKTVYDENTETLEEDIEKTDKEVEKETILINISKGISTNFNFSNKTYGEVNYLDLINRAEAWGINSKVYKKLNHNDRMKFIIDVLLIVNDSTENMQQIYQYSDKITSKYGYGSTDIVVNTNLLYEKLKGYKYKESKYVKTIERGEEVVFTDFKPTKKQKKKYSKLVSQLRGGKIGDTTYKNSTYEYIEDDCIYNTSYVYARSKDKNRLINTELFAKMTKQAQKDFLMDICVMANRQANLKYYGNKKQKELEKAYKDYILEIIKCDTSIDASDYMQATWNGDIREKAILENN